MSTISDEIANLAQHAKDVVDKVGGQIATEYRELLAKISGQVRDVAETVKADAESDAADVKTDVTNVEQEVATDTGSTGNGTANAGSADSTLTPSQPPASQPTTTAVPNPDITGGPIQS